ncbi:Hypothetical predicted protein, partial [Olea europaea subsp. europaea]
LVLLAQGILLTFSNGTTQYFILLGSNTFSFLPFLQINRHKAKHGSDTGTYVTGRRLNTEGNQQAFDIFRWSVIFNFLVCNIQHKIQFEISPENRFWLMLLALTTRPQRNSTIPSTKICLGHIPTSNDEGRFKAGRSEIVSSILGRLLEDRYSPRRQDLSWKAGALLEGKKESHMDFILESCSIERTRTKGGQHDFRTASSTNIVRIIKQKTSQIWLLNKRSKILLEAKIKPSIYL